MTSKRNQDVGGRWKRQERQMTSKRNQDVGGRDCRVDKCIDNLGHSPGIGYPSSCYSQNTRKHKSAAATATSELSPRSFHLLFRRQSCHRHACSSRRHALVLAGDRVPSS